MLILLRAIFRCDVSKAAARLRTELLRWGFGLFDRFFLLFTRGFNDALFFFYFYAVHFLCVELHVLTFWLRKIRRRQIRSKKGWDKSWINCMWKHMRATYKLWRPSEKVEHTLIRTTIHVKYQKKWVTYISRIRISNLEFQVWIKKKNICVPLVFLFHDHCPFLLLHVRVYSFKKRKEKTGTANS